MRCRLILHGQKLSYKMRLIRVGMSFKKAINTHITLIVVILVAGVVVAAGAAFYLLPRQHGVYVGPGLPHTILIDSQVGNITGSYYAQGFVFNTSVWWINGTEIGFGGTTTTESGLMNQSQYLNLENNNSISWLGGYTAPDTIGFFNYQGSGPATVYFVWIQTGNSTATFQATLSITAD